MKELNDSDKSSNAPKSDLYILILTIAIIASFVYLMGVFIIAIASNVVGWLLMLSCGIVILYYSHKRFKSLIYQIFYAFLKNANVNLDDRVVLVSKEQEKLWQEFVKQNKLSRKSDSVESISKAGQSANHE